MSTKRYFYEVRRFCSGDGKWTKWEKITDAAAQRYMLDESCEVRLVRVRDAISAAKGGAS